MLNNCPVGLYLFTERHNAVLDLLADLLRRQGRQIRVDDSVAGENLRPDIELFVSGSRVMIDVSISYDTLQCLEAAHQRKVSKYRHLGTILPLVVGSLGSWAPRNEEIRSLLGIDGRAWGTFRQKARVAAVKGSVLILDQHFTGRIPRFGAGEGEEDDIPPDGNDEESFAPDSSTE